MTNGAPDPTGGTEPVANSPSAPSKSIVEGSMVALRYPLKTPLSYSIYSTLLLGRAGLENISRGAAALKYSCTKCGKKEYTRYHSCACYYAKCNPKVIPKKPDPFRCDV